MDYDFDPFSVGAADYYDLDSILAEQQAIPATFRIQVPGMGYLEGSEESEDILQGTKINVPLWLAELLSVENYIETDLPKAFSEPVLRALRASASKVDVHALSPYYFLFAQKFIRMARDPVATNLSNALSEAFRTRLSDIMDFAKTRLEEHSSEFVQALDLTERELLKKGQDSSLELKKWMMRDPVRIKKAATLALADSNKRGYRG
ncbi:DNA replication protein [Blastocladiella emersonii ATCC 22665]|nr:DNA replication protein [Blastocladiella emersonii ATCC 22665]